MSDVIAIEKLKAQFPEAVVGVQEFRGETTVTVRAEELVDVCTFLRDDPQLRYTTLLFVAGLDRSELVIEPRFAPAREALLPSSAAISRMMGAAFMKLGRAPTMCLSVRQAERIFINSFLCHELHEFSLIFLLCHELHEFSLIFIFCFNSW